MVSVVDFLKKVPLFADLPAEDLTRLCAVVVEEQLPAGNWLFKEGETGDKTYVITSGSVDILKESDGRRVLLATRHAGEVIGEMSLLDQSPRFASGRTRTASRLLAITHTNLEQLLETSPSAARVLLATITNRLRTTELILSQSEKMAQLGTLTAGIAHELNNPAAAAGRASEQLHQAIGDLQLAYQELYAAQLSEAQWLKVSELKQAAESRAAQPLALSSLERSDREEAVEAWLAGRGVPNGWEHAPTLVSLGYAGVDLDALEQLFSAAQLAVALQWLCAVFNTFNLLEEVHQGTSRIGEIVRSLKAYSYLDQAPVQEVDIHQGLENTLVMLRGKLKDGITLDRHYDENVPRILAYASELNQVWTNIIDNAIDAMEGRGTITISTHREGDWVIVDLVDSGPGIPPGVRRKLFSPFFTTKPFGKGTGLGLNISSNIIQKHGGEIRVSSVPGNTRFSVRLPIDFQKSGAGISAPGPIAQVPDERLAEILRSTRTIAVLGISDRKADPAHTITRYLSDQGYTLIPICADCDPSPGEDAYPDLLSVPVPVDLVLVCSPSESVLAVVDQAAAIGARVVWLQEGIVDLDAADKAGDAGIEIVMDTCIRLTHQRLLGE